MTVGGFVIVAIACLLVSVALSSEAAMAYGVRPPLGLDRLAKFLQDARIRNWGEGAKPGSRNRLGALVASAVVVVVTQSLMVKSVIDAQAVNDVPRSAVAAIELLAAGLWFVLLWRRVGARSTDDV